MPSFRVASFHSPFQNLVSNFLQFLIFKPVTQIVLLFVVLPFLLVFRFCSVSSVFVPPFNGFTIIAHHDSVYQPPSFFSLPTSSRLLCYCFVLLALSSFLHHSFMSSSSDHPTRLIPAVLYLLFSTHTSPTLHLHRALQPVATCCQSSYLHNPAIIIVTPVSL